MRAQTASPCSHGRNVHRSKTMGSLMAKTEVERQRDSIAFWIDWITAVVGCIAWAFALTCYAVLLISIGD